MQDEAHLQVLRALQDNPKMSQRALSAALGISLGKTNYCLKALIEAGWVKARNFRNSTNKLAYAYVLTPTGAEAKARLTIRFLQSKSAEFEALKAEIAELRREADQSPDPGTGS